MKLEKVREVKAEVETLGGYAYRAIQKHFKKSVKYEAAVLKDKDPEPLHQMRVGMRRLRTALQVFDPALDLPKATGVKQIHKIAKRLGAVRDLDVLRAKLEDHYRPQLQGEEQAQLDVVLDHLRQQRRQEFARIQQTLDGSRYRRFKRSFTAWLDQPQYEAIAPLPILQTSPDLLLPLISQLLLHPGWLVGVEMQGSEVKASEPTRATQWLEQQSEVLHDLRKQMKRVRYQAQFFTELYDPSYEAQIQEFQTVQEVLGQIQDSSILSEFLVNVKANWQRRLPTLAQQLQQEQVDLWETWRSLQQRYLNPEFREELRRLFLQPSNHEQTSHSKDVRGEVKDRKQ